MAKVLVLRGILAGVLMFAYGPLPSWSAEDESLAPVSKRLVSFNSQPLPLFDAQGDLSIPAVLSIPARRNNSVPAVIILHGSAGMDSRGELHSRDLNQLGIATLELDMWGARGIEGGASGRPTRVHDTLPDLAGALSYLAKYPGIDPARIGVVGFSWGGVQAMLASTATVSAELVKKTGVRVTALAAFYPVCWGYNRVPGYEFKMLAPVRLIVLTGGDDQYDDDPAACPSLISALPHSERIKIDIHVYEGAQHGFNGFEAAQQYEDPFLHRGKGGVGTSAPHAIARETSRQAVRDFFTDAFEQKDTSVAHSQFMSTTQRRDPLVF
ncbi:dienelactone hydrolase [Pseudomonas sp. BIGb0408]|uniref:Dienelactone hydrolase n=1 Tax=Phytopseudomonas flavescens TaxID=29435 RepID=A0A7Y9XKG8_9GAMM|nr:MULTISPECIES: dienelactone hydrolase family protein [Pseudomonas]MCW2292379.1 dienelactone hydrolase [Pseudomonas sp. BIGb0408]NYH73050.1 dienelactone hydrolase [Pseudomonas flavescens]